MLLQEVFGAKVVDKCCSSGGEGTEKTEHEYEKFGHGVRKREQNISQ